MISVLVALVTGKNFVVRELVTGTQDEPSLTWKAAAALGGKLNEEDRLQPKRWLNYAGPPTAPGNKESGPGVRLARSIRRHGWRAEPSPG